LLLVRDPFFAFLLVMLMMLVVVVHGVLGSGCRWEKANHGLAAPASGHFAGPRHEPGVGTSSSVWELRRAMTGHGACRVTASASLLGKRRDRPFRPCVPITIRSLWVLFAASTMEAAAEPRATSVSAWTGDPSGINPRSRANIASSEGSGSGGSAPNSPS